MNEIVIPVEVRNPGCYLAVCGIAEIVGGFDYTSVSLWDKRPVPLGDVTIPADACVFETALDGAELAGALMEAFSDPARWELTRLDGLGVPLENAGRDEHPARIRVRVKLGQTARWFVIDHWYHLLPRGDDLKATNRLQDGKSPWKFWAGQMSLQKTLLGDKKKRGLVTALAPTEGLGEPPGTIAGLLAIQSLTGSSLNLDAAARAGALDRGVAANEAKRGSGDATACRPALELLAAIGLSAFFPPRRLGKGDGRGRYGTSGFDGQGIRYHLWHQPAPLPLARLLARRANLPGREQPLLLRARRGTAGGKNYRFEYVRGMGLAAAIQEQENENAGAD